MKRLAVLFILLAVPGCGDEDGGPPPCPDPEGLCIAAKFSFATGEEFYFVGLSSYSTPSAGKAQIKAWDAGDKIYAIAFIWDAAKITGPGSFTPRAGATVELLVTRPHPTKPPPNFRYTSTRNGSLSFTAVSSAKGSVVKGVFDGLRLIRNDPDEKIDLTVSGGTFAAKVK